VWAVFSKISEVAIISFRSKSCVLIFRKMALATFWVKKIWSPWLHQRSNFAPLQRKYKMKYLAVIKVGFFYFLVHIMAVSFAGKQKCKNPLLITKVSSEFRLNYGEK
jgi:hypothetical protein